jgi:hypothetical protein
MIDARRHDAPLLYNARMRRRWSRSFVLVAAGLAFSASAVFAQPPVARPQPPPTVPGAAAQPAPAKPTQPKPAPGPATVQPPSTTTAPRTVAEAPPPASALGVQLYPSAQYLGSYDAGRGQRFYLYGCTQPFAEVVGYYRLVLKDKGELIFDAPAMHQFDVGRYKETDVEFTPGVTIKDYTWGGSPGYMNPKPGASPSYYPTVIQIVSPPAGMGGRPR